MKNLKFIIPLILCLALQSCDDSSSDPDTEKILDSVTISPNPFSEEFDIKIGLEVAGTYSIKVHDVQGNLEISSSFEASESNNYTETVVMDTQANGTYFVTIGYLDNDISIKIIKEAPSI